MAVFRELPILYFIDLVFILCILFYVSTRQFVPTSMISYIVSIQIFSYTYNVLGTGIFSRYTARLLDFSYTTCIFTSFSFGGGGGA